MSVRKKRALALVIAIVFLPALGRADDRVLCLVAVDGVADLDAIVSRTVQQCEDGNALRLWMRHSEGGKLSQMPLYVPGMLCRLDQQIIYGRDGDEVLCTYRGKQRSPIR